MGKIQTVCPLNTNLRVLLTPLRLVTFPVYFSNILCKQMQTYLRLCHQVENASYM